MTSLDGSPRLRARPVAYDPPTGTVVVRPGVTEPIAGDGGQVDDEPFLVAFQAELAYIFASLRRMGVAGGDVEDLAQEVFLVLRARWTSFDVSRPLRPYLFGIVFRVAAAHRRRSRRIVVGEVPETADPRERPDQVLQGKQARRLLASALDTIPLPRRAVLIMYDLDEVPVRVIAAVLGIPKFTVYSRLRKARAELAEAARGLRHLL